MNVDPLTRRRTVVDLAFVAGGLAAAALLAQFVLQRTPLTGSAVTSPTPVPVERTAGNVAPCPVPTPVEPPRRNHGGKPMSKPIENYDGKVAAPRTVQP